MQIEDKKEIDKTKMLEHWVVKCIEYFSQWS
jgi:hypothetical protein